MGDNILKCDRYVKILAMIENNTLPHHLDAIKKMAENFHREYNDYSLYEHLMYSITTKQKTYDEEFTSWTS